MATDLRQGPLHEQHAALGAKFTEFAGWAMPVAYPAGTVAEHLACRRRVAVFDVSHLATLAFTGRTEIDRVASLLSNDLTAIAPGATQYTLLLDDAGGVRDDLVAWWVEPDLLHVLANAANVATVQDCLGGTDVTSSRALLALQGPRARDLLEAWDPRAAVARHEVRTFDLDGVRVVAAGTGYTGEDGIELSIPVVAAPGVWEQWLVRGAEPAGLGARDTLRLEAGLPLHGADLGPWMSPYEAGVGWAVAPGRSFPGAQAAEHARATATHHRVGIVTEGRRPPRAHAEVMADDRVVGSVTSGNWSPVLECGIALARVERSVTRGDRVALRVREHRLDGTVVPLPFVRRGSGAG